MAGADPGGCGNAPPGPRTVPWGTPEAASVRRGKSSAGSPLRPKPGSASCEGDRTPPDEPIRIYAATREEVEARRKTFDRKWRLKHRAVADSLREAGDRSSPSPICRQANGAAFAPPTRSSGCHEELKRRIKTQTVLPSADTAAMLFWALLASGQMNMRKVDGWQTLATKPIDQPIDLAA
jgi:putative transposase